MQTILTYFAMLLTGLFLQAQNSIVVDITGFESNKGSVMVGLYNEESTFLKESHQSLSSEITDKKASLTFTDIPDGVYAISCYHDEDDNGELNFFMGMYPKEDTGASNNAPAKFGPPKWEDAKFEVKNGEVKTLEINL